jgi:glycosyltransferase involved in cell wall biosynthesis
MTAAPAPALDDGRPGPLPGQPDGLKGSRPCVLLVGPLPPPIGGISSYAEAYLRSPVAAAFHIVHLNQDQLGKYRLTGLRRRLVNLGNTAVLAVNLLRILRVYRPKLAHILTGSFGGFFEKSFLALLCRLAGCRVVMHVLGGMFGEFYHRSSAPARALIHRCLRLNHRVAVLSEELREVFLGIGVEPGRLAVLGNAVSAPERSIWASPKQAEGAAVPGDGRILTVLFLGRIDRAKGVFELVEAARRVCAGCTGVRFRIIGPASAISAELGERVAAAGLAGRVELSPAVDEPTKAAAYLGADVYVLPSHVEGLPTGLLEAMSYGLPCIVTPVGGVPDVITHAQNGLLVPVGDAGALAGAIEELAGDPALRRRLGTAARASVLGRFDWNTQAGEIARLYRELLMGREALPARA